MRAFFIFIMLKILISTAEAAPYYPEQIYFNGMLWKHHAYTPLTRGFSHYPYGWCYHYGDDILLNCDNGIPLKKEAGSDQGSVLHLKGKHHTGGWRAEITLPSWVTGNFKSRLPSAQLQMKVKATHPTSIQIGFSDRSFQRLNPLKLTIMWPNDLNITQHWQTFFIPLADLINQNPTFDPANTFTFFIQSGQSKHDFDIEISDIRITSQEKESIPTIRFNQHAYTSHAKKQAVIQANLGQSVQLLNATNSSIVLEKNLSDTHYEASSQEWVHTFDFSEVSQVGTYILRVGQHQSSPFEIQDRPMQQLAKDSLTFFYLQRASIDIHLAPWQHKAAHLNPAKLLSNPRKEIDVRGGWYDAGDFGRYATTTGLSTGVLLLLAEIGHHYQALQEARIGLDWLIKMQADDGGVYHKVASESGNDQHKSTGPEQNTHPLYIIDRMLGSEGSTKTTADTALSAAVWATAARLWKTKNTTLSNQYEQAALKAWKYLEKHPHNTPKRGFFDPPESHGGPYGPNTSDHDERLWAAASLWHLTGKQCYRYAMVQHFNHVHIAIPNDKRHPWAEVDNFAVYATILAEKHHKKQVSPYFSTLASYRDTLLYRLNQSPHAWPLDKKDVVWGSNSLVAYLALDLIMIDQFLGGEKGTHGARKIMDYLLGMNPMAYSYISGYGKHSVQNFFHSWFHHDGLDQVPKGFLAGGPNAEQGHWISQSPLRCYRDEKSDWFSNEVAINWNAALSFISHMIDKDDARHAHSL